MKKIVAIICAALMLATLCACQSKAEEKYTIGICQQMTHDALDAATQGFKDALVEELGEDNTQSELQRYREQTDALKAPAVVKDTLREEIRRLENRIS